MALPRPLRLAFLSFALPAAWLMTARPCFAAEDEKDDAAESKPKSDGDESEAPKAAKADDAKPAPDKEAKNEGYGHLGQIGLRAGLVVGYRMVVRYSGSPFCRTPDGGSADSQPTFCGHGAPLATDLALSFGVLDFLEPYAWARLGLAPEKETDTNPLVVIGAGVRLYTMSDAPFKIFIDPAVGLELEGGRGTPAWQLNSPVYKNDFMFKIAAGPQYDFARAVGIYASGEVTVTVVRALASSFNLTFGVQGRLP